MLGISEGKILSQEEKSKPEYGVKCVKQMFATYTNSPIGIGYNSIDYIKNMDLAMGRPAQFRDNIARFLGARQNDLLTSYGINSIDPQLVNLCPKFVNNVHGKLMSFQYEIGVDVIDAASTSEKEQMRKELEAYVKLKDFYENMGIEMQKLHQDIGIDEMPNTQEDVELIMTNTYKHYEAMRAELELKKIHNVNDWDAIKSKFIWELIVQGQAGVRTYVDERGDIREEWFPMNRFLCSYSETEDFDKLTNAGYIDYITTDQFFAEARDSMPDNEILQLIKNYSTTNFAMSAESPTFILPQQGTGNVKYMRIMRFQFIEEDVENYVKRKDKDGNIIVEKKKAGFKVAPEEMQFYANGEKEHLQVTTRTKYGGTWLIGTESVYDYGIIQQGDDVRLDYHVYAPNMRNGRVTSLVAQIREPLEFISVAWTRLKDVVGKGYNGKLELNIDLMADITLGKGGAPNLKNVLDLFAINDIVLAKNKRNAHDQNIGRAIEILNMGLTSTDFMNAIELGINMIRNICGVNELSDGSTPKAGTLNGVMEMSNDATSNNINYLYRAYNSVYRRASLACLGYWKQIPSNNAWNKIYTVGIEAATTREEWARFYNMLEKMGAQPLIDGGLKTSDIIELWNVKNLKQAEFMAKNRGRKNMAEARAIQSQMMEQQAQQSQQAAQIANQSRQEQMVLELEMFKQKESFLTSQIIARQEKINEGMLMVKETEVQGRMGVADMQGRDSVLKTMTMNQSDQKIQEMKMKFEAYKAEMEDKFRNIELELKQEELRNELGASKEDYKKIITKEEYDALPKGAKYIDSIGKKAIKK